RKRPAVRQPIRQSVPTQRRKSLETSARRTGDLRSARGGRLAQFFFTRKPFCVLDSRFFALHDAHQWCLTLRQIQSAQMTTAITETPEAGQKFVRGLALLDSTMPVHGSMIGTGIA